VKEIKITEFRNGTTRIYTVVFDFNEKYQLIKKYFKENPTEYESYSYRGDIVSSIKNYQNNNLIAEYLNPMTINNDIITISMITQPNLDTVILMYKFEGSLISETIFKINRKIDNIELRYAYEYSSGKLTGYLYRNFKNNVEGKVNYNKVVSSDDKSNPYINASRINKVLLGLGSDETAQGINNILESQTLQPSTGVIQPYFYQYDSEGYVISSTVSYGASSYKKDYTYTR
ncbi:MAG: hypothetical protein ACRC2O_06355, partial [Chitinophagaceae bacterium]